MSLCCLSLYGLRCCPNSKCLLADVTKLFGPEMVLLWSALLMKKRVVVYSEKLTVLLRVIRALPLLVSYRQNWSILRPLVTLQGDLEIADLKVRWLNSGALLFSSTFFVA